MALHTVSLDVPRPASVADALGARNFLEVVVRLTRLLPSETKAAMIALAAPTFTYVSDIVASLQAIHRFVDDEGNLLVDEYGNTFFEL